MSSQKVTKHRILSFRRKPESSIFKQLQSIWTPPGLDPGSTGVTTFYECIKIFGLSYIWKSMQDDYRLWENPFRDLCRKAREVQIKDIIKGLSEGQSVSADDSLVKCFHLFVMNRHDALFVVEGDKTIIGLLRFSDVYRKASRIMKECSI